MAAWLLEDADTHENVDYAYITLTRASAKRIMWRSLRQFDRQYSLGLRFNTSELMVETQSGSRIYLGGASNADDIEKFRGMAFRRVAIDECASFRPHIEELVEEVIEPTLIDYDGQLALIGSPAATCAGLFHDVTNTSRRPGWSRHHWTILDNSYIPHAAQWLAQRMEQKGWGPNHPAYLREWKGLWVRDAESLVYAWDESRNGWDSSLPTLLGWRYTMGVDLGHDDATAFVLLAYHHKQPNAYYVHSEKRSGMDVEDVAERMKELRRIYSPRSIVVDTGGLGKMICETFRRRYHIPCKAAEKQHKQAHIETLNADLHAGRLLADPDGELAREWEVLQWDATSVKRQEDPNYDNHCADAALYAHVESRHYVQHPDEQRPKPGTPEYYQQVERELEHEAEREPVYDEADSLWG